MQKNRMDGPFQMRLGGERYKAPGIFLLYIFS